MILKIPFHKWALHESGYHLACIIFLCHYHFSVSFVDYVPLVIEQVLYPICTMPYPFMVILHITYYCFKLQINGFLKSKWRLFAPLLMSTLMIYTFHLYIVFQPTRANHFWKLFPDTYLCKAHYIQANLCNNIQKTQRYYKFGEIYIFPDC